MTEDDHSPTDMFGIGDEIDVVSRQHLVIGGRNESPPIPDNRDDDDVEIWEDTRQLAQRCVDNRTIFTASDPHHPNASIREGNTFERPRHLQTPRYGARDLDLRGNNYIDWHMVAAEQICPYGLQIALVANPGNFGWHIKQRMRDLTGNHIDFIGLGYGDDHVDIRRPCSFQDIRMRGKSDKSLDIEGIPDPPNQVWRLIYDRYIMTFGGQLPGNMEADLTGSANNNFHRTVTPFFVVLTDVRFLGSIAGDPK
jgi:hypothetical protein